MENTTIKPQQVEFEFTESLQLENSFGVLKSKRDIKLDVTVGIKDDTYGWFEFYDIETGGAEWYAEGGLCFTNGELTDYDGVFSLPNFVLDKLQELGINVDEMRDTLND
jgi:hypothetical protein